MFSLKGRNALVTGAAGGLGSAIVEALAEAGASVAITDLDEAAAASTAGAAATRFDGRRFPAIRCDVTDEASVRGAFAEAEAALGPIDTLVNVAGTFHAVRFEEMSLAAWRALLACHLDGTFLCTRQALPEHAGAQFRARHLHVVGRGGGGSGVRGRVRRGERAASTGWCARWRARWAGAASR